MVHTRSSGVTMVCVGPQAMMPPTVQAAKYEPEKSSIFLCGFKASILPDIVVVLMSQLLLSGIVSSIQDELIVCKWQLPERKDGHRRKWIIRAPGRDN